jgi:tetratricopeptide (TPR) repeat protein
MNRGTRILAALVVLAALAGCSKKVVRTEAPTTGPATAGEHVIEHRIVTGETLALIADNYYGDPARATQVARDNDLADPDLVTPGSVLRLRFSDDEWAEARRRADALAAYNRGVDLMGQERLSEAERQFRQALDTAPGLVAARYNLALVLVQRGRATEALPLLEQLTDERPDDRDFRFARGHALFSAAMFAEAADQFGQVLALDPGHRRAAFGMARALEEDGRREEAMAAWEDYLVLDPDSSWAGQARRRLQALRDGE